MTAPTAAGSLTTAGRQGPVDVRAGPGVPLRRRPPGLPGPGHRLLRAARPVRVLRPAALHPRQGHPAVWPCPTRMPCCEIAAARDACQQADAAAAAAPSPRPGRPATRGAPSRRSSAAPARPPSSASPGPADTGERGGAAAGARYRRRAAAAQAVHHAPARPRAADHREDPAVGARGTAADPDRRRDHRPRRLQRRGPA